MTTNKQLSVRAKELARLAPVEDLPLAWSSTKGYADGTPAQRAALSASCTIELRPGLRVPNSRTHLEAIAKRLANYPDAAKSGSPRASVGAAARKPAKPSKARDFAAAVETIEGAMENAMAANWGASACIVGDTLCAASRRFFGSWTLFGGENAPNATDSQVRLWDSACVPLARTHAQAIADSHSWEVSELLHICRCSLTGSGRERLDLYPLGICYSTEGYCNTENPPPPDMPHVHVNPEYLLALLQAAHALSLSHVKVTLSPSTTSVMLHGADGFQAYILGAI
jgi:hypothetical protein